MMTTKTDDHDEEEPREEVYSPHSNTSKENYPALARPEVDEDGFPTPVPTPAPTPRATFAASTRAVVPPRQPGGAPAATSAWGGQGTGRGVASCAGHSAEAASEGGGEGEGSPSAAAPAPAITVAAPPQEGGDTSTTALAPPPGGANAPAEAQAAGPGDARTVSLDAAPTTATPPDGTLRDTMRLNQMLGEAVRIAEKQGSQGLADMLRERGAGVTSTLNAMRRAAGPRTDAEILARAARIYAQMNNGNTALPKAGEMPDGPLSGAAPMAFWRAFFQNSRQGDDVDVATQVCKLYANRTPPDQHALSAGHKGGHALRIDVRTLPNDVGLHKLFANSGVDMPAFHLDMVRLGQEIAEGSKMSEDLHVRLQEHAKSVVNHGSRYATCEYFVSITNSTPAAKRSAANKKAIKDRFQPLLVLLQDLKPNQTLYHHTAVSSDGGLYAAAFDSNTLALASSKQIANAARVAAASSYAQNVAELIDDKGTMIAAMTAIGKRALHEPQIAYVVPLSGAGLTPEDVNALIFHMKGGNAQRQVH